jgi:acyl-CoA thioester hydrolase
MSEQDKERWHQTTIRVRYKDTDRMGVVYYGNYLTFFEVGRAEFMRDIGFAYAAMEVNGYSLVVTEAAAKYHANVGYDSMVKILTKIDGLTRVRVRFEYRIFDETDRLLVSGHTVHACLNAGEKVTRLPEELKTILQRELAR